MTQTTVRSSGREPVPALHVVPRPRTPEPSTIPDVLAPAMTDDQHVVHAPPRRASLAIALDSAMALAVAVAAIVLEALPAAGGCGSRQLDPAAVRVRPLPEAARGTPPRGTSGASSEPVSRSPSSRWHGTVAHRGRPRGPGPAHRSFAAVSGDAPHARPRGAPAALGARRPPAETSGGLDRAGAAADSHEIVAPASLAASKDADRRPPGLRRLSARSPRSAERHQADAMVVLPGARLSATQVRRLHWALTGVGTGLRRDRPPRRDAPREPVCRPPVGSPSSVVLRPPCAAPALGSRRGSSASPRPWASRSCSPVLARCALSGLIARPGHVPPAAGGPRRPHLHPVQAPLDVASAERERARLETVNEADEVLFKIQQDPRITRLGPVAGRTAWTSSPSSGTSSRRHVARRPVTGAAGRGGRVRHGPPAAPRRQARMHRAVAGVGTFGPHLGGACAPRPALRRQLVAGTRLRDLVRTVRAVVTRRGAY